MGKKELFSFAVLITIIIFNVNAQQTTTMPTQNIPLPNITPQISNQVNEPLNLEETSTTTLQQDSQITTPKKEDIQTVTSASKSQNLSIKNLNCFQVSSRG